MWGELNDPGWLSVVLIVLLLVAAQAGAFLGRRQEPAPTKDVRGLVDSLQATVLALLGLLLAFTFSMAADRYETRRALVLAEANAIGTAHLRALGLPEPAAGAVRAHLVDYVDARLAFYAAGEDRARIEAADARAQAIQAVVWSRAMEEARREPTALPPALLLAALNDVIDLYEARIIAMEGRVPGPILWMLMLVAVIGIGTVGYSYGLLRHSPHVATALLALLVAAIVFVILDLDQPRQSLIPVSQRSMMDLRDSLQRRGP